MSVQKESIPAMTFDRKPEDVMLTRAKHWPVERTTFNKKLNLEAINKIASALEIGHFPQFACAGAGINFNSFLAWLNKGKHDYNRLEHLDGQGVEIREQDYSMECELYIRVQEAMFKMQDTPLSAINKAAKHDYKAAGFFLERRMPKQWGRSEVKTDDVHKGNTVVQTIIMVPAQAKDNDEWIKMVEQRKNGDIALVDQKAIPGDSKAEIPVGDNNVDTAEDDFESVLGITG